MVVVDITTNTTAHQTSEPPAHGTNLIRAKPLIVQNKMDSIGKTYMDYQTKSTFRRTSV